MTLLVFMAAVAAATAGYIFKKEIPPGAVAPAFAAFVILLVPFLGFGLPDVAGAFRAAASRGPAGPAGLVALVAVPPAAALVAARGAGGLPAAGGLLVYAAVPALLGLLASRRGEPPGLLDAAAVLAAWLPVELGALGGAWAVDGADPSYVLGKVMSVSVLLTALAAVRPLGGIGYAWRLRLEDLGVALASLAAFLVLALPYALASGFVVFEPRPVSVGGILYRFLAVGLLIALPEEILFRGAIFNLLQRWTAGRQGPMPALLLSSVIFGVSHMNNFPYLLPDLDLRYTLLATWAGVCYGWCYLKTGNLTAGILTHTAVDVIHRVVFTFPKG